MELSSPGHDEEHLLLRFELPLGRAPRDEADQPLLQPFTAVRGVEGDPNGRRVAVLAGRLQVLFVDTKLVTAAISELCQG